METKILSTFAAAVVVAVFFAPLVRAIMREVARVVSFLSGGAV